jgi:predicted ferric reductase
LSNSDPPRHVTLARAATAAAVVAGAAVLLAVGADSASAAAPHLAAVGHGAARHALVLVAEGEGTGPDAALRKEAALAGYLSYGLMAATVVYGIFLATGWAKRIVGHNAVYQGHLALALTSMTFGVMHALSYVLQTQTHFSIVETFVPFVGGGEIEVALGIIGLELMIGASVAVTLTHKLNYRRFRKVHIGGTYVGAALSWFHVIATSREAKMLGLFGVTLAAIALVPIVLGLLRLLPAARADRARLALQPVNA